MKYLSITQTAERWGISTRRIQILCSEGRVPRGRREASGRANQEREVYQAKIRMTI